MLALRLLSEGVEGPNTELIWLMYLGISFFFVVILSGWFFGTKKEEESESEMKEAQKEKNQPDLKSGKKKK